MNNLFHDLSDNILLDVTNQYLKGKWEENTLAKISLLYFQRFPSMYERILAYDLIKELYTRFSNLKKEFNIEC